MSSMLAYLTSVSSRWSFPRPNRKHAVSKASSEAGWEAALELLEWDVLWAYQESKISLLPRICTKSVH